MSDESATVERTRRVPRVVLRLRAHRHRRRLLSPIRPSARRALAEFRRQLDSLPETTHPIGL